MQSAEKNMERQENYRNLLKMVNVFLCNVIDFCIKPPRTFFDGMNATKILAVQEVF